MQYSNIENLRKILVEELEKNIGNSKRVLLPYDEEFLKQLIFDDFEFAETLEPVLKEIDYSNVNFDGFNVNGCDFQGFYGIKINPQTIAEKDLSYANYDGIEFIGPFDGVNVCGTNFTGSKGAKINPQTIFEQDLTDTVCCDVEFIDSFDNIRINGSKFEGSNYEKIINFENDFREKIKTLVLKNKEM